MIKKEKPVYGIHSVLEALKSNAFVDKVFIKKGLNADPVREIMHLANKQGVAIQYVPIEKLNRITSKNHQGVIAYLSLIEYTEPEMLVPAIFEKGESPFLLVLDGITDVRNFGGLARTAECAGCHGIIVPIGGSAQINEEAIKTSSGALNHIPVCRVKSLSTSIDFLKNSGIKVVGASEKSTDVLYRGNLSGPLAIVMGSEEKGISSSVINSCDATYRLPMFGQIGSLNVSAAASVFLFEAIRQRELK